VRVGVYIDAFNLYYGGRDLCGRGRPGWRWLDVRALAQDLLGRRHDWAGASIERVVYCTARIDAPSNPVGHQEQDVYLKALVAGNAVDWIEYGHYVARVKRAPLATPDRRGRPVLVTAGWPLKVQDRRGSPVRDARFMVSYAHREEKGSDVNVASHLLLDTMQGSVDAAIVISNDSDLRLPIQEVRDRLPVGLVNPSATLLAGALRGAPSDGIGRHWWTRLAAADFRNNQLTDPCGRYAKPPPW
jgi:hypothetical protein